MFYEEIFSDAWLGEFCKFADIPFKPADFSSQVNASPKSKNALPPELVREIVLYHKDTYLEVARRFGEERVARLWPNSRLLSSAAQL